jgi:hypothetical protein
MRRVIRKRIRRQDDGISFAADINVDLSVNVGRSGQPHEMSSDVHRATADNAAARDSASANRSEEGSTSACRTTRTIDP